MGLKITQYFNIKFLPVLLYIFQMSPIQDKVIIGQKIKTTSWLSPNSTETIINWKLCNNWIAFTFYTLYNHTPWKIKPNQKKSFITHFTLKRQGKVQLCNVAKFFCQAWDKGQHVPHRKWSHQFVCWSSLSIKYLSCSRGTIVINNPNLFTHLILKLMFISLRYISEKVVCWRLAQKRVMYTTLYIYVLL